MSSFVHDLPGLIAAFDEYAFGSPKEGDRSAASKLSNVNWYIEAPEGELVFYPLRWLIEGFRNGERFEGTKTEYYDLRQDFLPDLERAGYMLVEQKHQTFEAVWNGLLDACGRLDTKPSGLDGIPDQRDRKFLVLEALWTQSALTPQEAASAGGEFEGAVRQIKINRYERSPANRRACIAHATREGRGLLCVVCKMDFLSRYGTRGRGFIHIHHLNPLGGTPAPDRVDPIRDLVPVCPNCHAMLHSKAPPLTPEQLRLEMPELATE